MFSGNVVIVVLAVQVVDGVKLLTKQAKMLDVLETV